MSSTASSSPAADTVTVCSLAQSVVVNVRLAGFRVTSVFAGTAIATVTLAVGSVASFTV